MKRSIIFVVFLVVAVACLGCESMGANTKKGAGMGGLLGSVVGGVVGHQTGHGVEGALIGGAVGAIGGGAIGSGIDDEQNKAAQTTSSSSDSTHLSMVKIIEMSSKGIPDNIIIDQIQATGSTYDIDGDTVQYLKDNGVSDKVIGYMVATQ